MTSSEILSRYSKSILASSNSKNDFKSISITEPFSLKLLLIYFDFSVVDIPSNGLKIFWNLENIQNLNIKTVTHSGIIAEFPAFDFILLAFASSRY